MNIETITIIKSDMADLVLLWTDLPSPVPNLTKQNAVLKLEVAQGSAEEYVAQYFPKVFVTIVNKP